MTWAADPTTLPGPIRLLFHSPLALFHYPAIHSHPLCHLTLHSFAEASAGWGLASGGRCTLAHSVHDLLQTYLAAHLCHSWSGAGASTMPDLDCSVNDLHFDAFQWSSQICHLICITNNLPDSAY